MSRELALPTLIALGKPTLGSLAVLGEISILVFYQSAEDAVYKALGVE